MLKCQGDGEPYSGRETFDLVELGVSELAVIDEGAKDPVGEFLPARAACESGKTGPDKRNEGSELRRLSECFRYFGY